jgi:hypothetical protein
MTRLTLTLLLVGTLLLTACLPTSGDAVSTPQPVTVAAGTPLSPTPTMAVTATTAVATLESATATVPAAVTEAPVEPTATTPSVSLPVSATLEADLGNGLSLYSIPGGQSGSVPTYTITTKTPLLVGADSPAVTAFNQAVASLVEQQVADFLPNSGGFGEPFSEFGSYLDVSYQLTAAGPDWLSLNFLMSVYIDGAAHPYHYTIAYTYDLANNRPMTLAELFQPDSPYLERMANYAIQELTEREVLFVPEGANPTEENYRHWNITPEGVMITFDEYQVAPYAAGRQQVTIPYSELADLINPAGPLVAYLQ